MTSPPKRCEHRYNLDICVYCGEATPESLAPAPPSGEKCRCDDKDELCNVCCPPTAAPDAVEPMLKELLGYALHPPHAKPIFRKALADCHAAGRAEVLKQARPILDRISEENGIGIDVASRFAAAIRTGDGK